jgi:predicted metalloprotease
MFRFLEMDSADPSLGRPAESAPPADASPEEERLVDFVSFILDDSQETWAELSQRTGRPYEPAKLVLFRGATPSACGMGRAAMGPFYCPGDQKVYIDLAFFEELRRRFGAPGDFAQAYVVAHEIGHHVQNQLGIERAVRQRQAAQPERANELSVRMELQADCFAGIWGHSTARRDILEQGDAEEGLNAAAAIGDDRIQQQTSGQVVPDAFTHGSSEQRVAWFNRGLRSGDVKACDTFGES